MRKMLFAGIVAGALAAAPAQPMLVTGTVAYFGTVSTSTITGVNVGDAFSAHLTFSYDPIGTTCRYLSSDPCGDAGAGTAVFSVDSGPIAGTDTFAAFRTITRPGGQTAFFFSFDSDDGLTTSQGNEATNTGFYQDPRGRLTLSAIDVPEPAAWMTMVVGFGMIGAAARTRQRMRREA